MIHVYTGYKKRSWSTILGRDDHSSVSGLLLLNGLVDDNLISYGATSIYMQSTAKQQSKVKPYLLATTNE